MKLVSFRRAGKIRIGGIADDSETVVDFSVAAPRLPADMPTFIEAGDKALAGAARAVKTRKKDARIPLTRLPQLGGHEAANPLIFGHWNIKGRHYRAPTGCGGWPSVRLGSAALAVAAMSCRVGSAEVRASCSAGCGAAGRGVGRRWSAGGHPPSGWWRTPR